MPPLVVCLLGSTNVLFTGSARGASPTHQRAPRRRALESRGWRRTPRLCVPGGLTAAFLQLYHYLDSDSREVSYVTG
jgi:hypothetical protein